MGSENLNDSNRFSARLAGAFRKACRTIVERITGFCRSVANVFKRNKETEFRPMVLERPTFRKNVVSGAPLPGAYTGIIASGTAAAETPAASAEEEWLCRLSEVMEEICVIPKVSAAAEEPRADPLTINPLAFAAGLDGAEPDAPTAERIEIADEAPVGVSPVTETVPDIPKVEECPIEEPMPEEPMVCRRSGIRMDSPLARVLSTPTGSGASVAPSSKYVFDFDCWDDWDVHDADVEVRGAEDLATEPAAVPAPPACLITEVDITVAEGPSDAAGAGREPILHAEDGGSDEPACEKPLFLAAPATVPALAIAEEPLAVPVGEPAESVSYDGDFSWISDMDPFIGKEPEEGVSYLGDFSWISDMGAFVEKEPAENASYDGNFSWLSEMDAFAGAGPVEAHASPGSDVPAETPEALLGGPAPMTAIAAPPRIFALPAATPREPVATEVFDIPALEDAVSSESAVGPVTEARPAWATPQEPAGTGIAFGVGAAASGGTCVSFSFCNGAPEPEESVEELSECFVPVPESVHACAPYAGFRLTL
ncbi:MAG: hypothetical protein GX224_05570 [Thermoplasmatales archaeon]|nr:hypothetical protein [Thermoplasmatales archaeon]